MRVEWVPNVSAGRDPAVVRTLEAVLKAVPGVALLHTDPGPHVDRTVFTCAAAGTAGQVTAALTAASVALAATAAEQIDMGRYRSVHPHVGALDVSPFVPLDAATTLDDCVAVARSAAAATAAQVVLPVWLYGAAGPAGREPAELRRGGPAGLAARMAAGETAPDFGPRALHRRGGAVLVGARRPMVAWNLNLNTGDPAPARQLAARLRESSGGMVGVRALGWSVPGLNRAQVSCNVLDPVAAPLVEIHRRCSQDARRLGVQVTGSELIGLIPQGALLAAGSTVEAAVAALGLDHLAPFQAQHRILERCLAAAGLGA